MRLLLSVTVYLLLSACEKKPVTINEVLLNQIYNGNFRQNQISIDSIVGGNWNILILMPPYFSSDHLTKCGIEQNVINNIIRQSPLETDIEEHRFYAVFANNIYNLKKMNGNQMLLNLATESCITIKKGQLLEIKNIAKDSSYIDYRLYLQK